MNRRCASSVRNARNLRGILLSAYENLLPDIAGILHATGMDASLLELEITESLLIRDVERTPQVLPFVARHIWGIQIDLIVQLPIALLGADYGPLT